MDQIQLVLLYAFVVMLQTAKVVALMLIFANIVRMVMKTTSNTTATCTSCPAKCQTCTYNDTNFTTGINVGLGIVSCTTCLNNFQLSYQYPYSCQQICGDQIIVTFPCDMRLGIQYDGCTDACEVENNFTCNVTNDSKSLCSYNIPIEMTVVKLQRHAKNNSFLLIVSVFPPLYVLKTTPYLLQVFKMQNENMDIVSAQFMPGTSQINF